MQSECALSYQIIRSLDTNNDYVSFKIASQTIWWTRQKIVLKAQIDNEKNYWNSSNDPDIEVVQYVVNGKSFPEHLQSVTAENSTIKEVGNIKRYTTLTPIEYRISVPNEFYHKLYITSKISVLF